MSCSQSRWYVHHGLLLPIWILLIASATRGAIAEQLAVWREQLDLDGLGRASQVTDHVWS
jgi:hypothetical protein